MISNQKNPLLSVISAQKHGIAAGIYSICSSNRYVLQAAMLKAKNDNASLLIEATSNQVNQFGGYTGMNPSQFIGYVKAIAEETDYLFEKVTLGGDHLGPNAWRNENAETAMIKARDLIHDYVAAGFSKIHLDASMPCADDCLPLADEIIAERSANLCEAAESVFTKKKSGFPALLYVIGTEVPTPGGETEEVSEPHITKADDVDRIISVTKEAFIAHGLHSAWERVTAVVVQPGVEFSVHSVIDYDREKASQLSRKIESYNNLLYEVHSTDYQARKALKEMVEDHFAILKVGPWLTFALREAVFALADIENEWLGERKTVHISDIRNVIEEVMCEDPKYWKMYYHGDEAEVSFARKYSYSDRIRYYWHYPKIQSTLEILLTNLSGEPIPLSLLSRYFPSRYEAVREKRIRSTPGDLIQDKIIDIIDKYAFACGTLKG
ncbi:MAG TPA: D-tagatose-bisphosphate aldolase, class II, non-catalytic subunit [bacterium]|nr:D-tagatose-bisphosphate aldolase, class II, non-catalytic subunit [bacterium]